MRRFVRQLRQAAIEEKDARVFLLYFTRKLCDATLLKLLSIKPDLLFEGEKKNIFYKVSKSILGKWKLIQLILVKQIARINSSLP